jgi:predicted nucleic acid-binding protein
MGKIEKILAAMAGNRVYFDTNIFIYFLQHDERFITQCLPFFAAVENGEIVGVSGDIAIAELLVKPMRDNDAVNVEKIKSIFADDGFFQAIPHSRATLELAAYLRATKKLKMIDAIHVASAIHAKCSHFITHDGQIFKAMKGIEVIDISKIEA